VAVFQGARTAAELDVADFSVLPVDLFTATDDGSRGHAGSVVELFLDTVCHEPVDWVSAAGPPGMLRALAGALETLGLSGEFSLEERMGCGIGACVCCSCRIGTPERWEYRRVCADGPVFPAREVVWE
jgi:dihydroorotate dehydrogenase electron transfer subunit